jgi:methyl-accepting chemotaxis protein
MNQEGDVNRLLGEVNSLAAHISEGRLFERLDISVYEGLDREIREEINALINAALLPYQFMAEKIRVISTGEIPDRIEEEFSGAFEDTRNNLNQCIDAINLLVSDAQMLARAAQEGDLKARADVSLHQGEFREIVEGLNNTLMAVAKPLQDAGRTLERMTVNDYTVRMDESRYKGDYLNLASDINKVLDWFGHITELVNQISVGDLSPFASLQKIGRRSDQDKLLPAFIKTFENLQNLMTDIQMLVDAEIGRAHV